VIQNILFAINIYFSGKGDLNQRIHLFGKVWEGPMLMVFTLCFTLCFSLFGLEGQFC